MSTPLTPQAPLTPQEQQQIARMLSDPFYFPLQFKTWLQWFIENAPGGIAGGSGGSSAGDQFPSVPIGGVIFWTTPTLPTNALWCNGAALSRIAYNALFQKIGTRYGAGDGSTTFNVPDVDGRVIVGWAQTGGHADVSTLGVTEGVGKGSRRPKHRTSNSLALNDPGHSHLLNHGANDGGTIYVDASLLQHEEATSSTTTTNQTGVTLGGSVGTNDPNDALDTPAYIVLPAIIRYI